jgi:hypothetical protein
MFNKFTHAMALNFQRQLYPGKRANCKGYREKYAKGGKG